MNTLGSPANKGVLNTISRNISSMISPNRSNVSNVSNGLKNVGVSNTSNILNTSNTSNTSMLNGSMWQISLSIVLVIFITLIALYWDSISTTITQGYDKVMNMLGFGTPAHNQPQSDQVLQAPPNPVTDVQNQEDENNKKFVESILPGRNQVFNVSKNSFTYYDAEPLCKALGAELATYDQVKQAYAQGADWCNYGWVKGQMAVYPTQEDTWNNIQQGPEEQRNSCGRPGLNGGHFDNAELRYGVNCYGVKPKQSEHDATAVASGSGAPLTPAGLEFEKKVQQYRGDANNISILPFNNQQWSS